MTVRVPDVLAAVDLGSNSFHMIVARYNHGQLVVLDRLREMVRLAAGLDEHGRLSREATQRALQCLDRRPSIRSSVADRFRRSSRPPGRGPISPARDLLSAFGPISGHQ